MQHGDGRKRHALRRDRRPGSLWLPFPVGVRELYAHVGARVWMQISSLATAQAARLLRCKPQEVEEEKQEEEEEEHKWQGGLEAVLEKLATERGAKTRSGRRAAETKRALSTPTVNMPTPFCSQLPSHPPVRDFARTARCMRTHAHRLRAAYAQMHRAQHSAESAAETGSRLRITPLCCTTLLPPETSLVLKAKAKDVKGKDLLSVSPVPFSVASSTGNICPCVCVCVRACQHRPHAHTLRYRTHCNAHYALSQKHRHTCTRSERLEGEAEEETAAQKESGRLKSIGR